MSQMMNDTKQYIFQPNARAAKSLISPSTPAISQTQNVGKSVRIAEIARIAGVATTFGKIGFLLKSWKTISRVSQMAFDVQAALSEILENEKRQKIALLPATRPPDNPIKPNRTLPSTPLQVGTVSSKGKHTGKVAMQKITLCQAIEPCALAHLILR